VHQQLKQLKNHKENKMAKGVKHYFKSGKEYKGATHKDTKGKLMSGKKHTASSKYLVHKKQLKKKK
jgi:hypothetical protein